MRGLFMSIHLFSIGLSMVLIGVYAPLVWSIMFYVLFFGSLYACETCKKNAKKSVSEVIHQKKNIKSEGLVVMTESEKAIQKIIKNKKK